MTGRTVALTAGFALALAGLALAAPSSIPRNTSADTGITTNAADNEFQNLLMVAQRAPPKQTQSRQPSNDGWGDIDPYSFGWRNGANTG